MGSPSPARAEPKEAHPGCIYLASVGDKDQRRTELRIEIADPGKDNNPERYAMAFKTVGPTSTGAGTEFQPCLVVDASRTVTIEKNLKVYARPDQQGASAGGLILRVKPESGSGGGGAVPPVAIPQDQVAPWDLVLRNVAVTRIPSGAALEITGKLDNTGRAPIIGVQLLVVIYFAGDPNLEPVRESPFRGVSVKPKEPVDLFSPEKPNERKITIALPTYLQGKELTVLLKAIGLAPPTTLTEVERRILVRFYLLNQLTIRETADEQQPVSDPCPVLRATVPASPDLQDEQAYHLEMRRRHNLALHSWGIVAGLEPRVDPASGSNSLQVGQGMAIDGYGRELVLASPAPIDLRLVNKDTTYDIWLDYQLVAPEPVGTSNGMCTEPLPGNRLEERPTVRLTPTITRRSPDPSQPNEVPAGDLDFRPDSPLTRRSCADVAGVPGRIAFQDRLKNWQVDQSERRYAGLVAERILGPASGQGRENHQPHLVAQWACS